MFYCLKEKITGLHFHSLYFYAPGSCGLIKDSLGENKNNNIVESTKYHIISLNNE